MELEHLHVFLAVVYDYYLDEFPTYFDLMQSEAPE
tara:strand:- start:46 stop:150 length:105 start_codon:yes stop_codon:yes gene_type:complete